MAHFAELDENNKVLRVTCVGNDEVAYNGDPAGETYCTNLLGGTWKQTSYNTRQGVHYDPNTWIPSEDQSQAFRWNYAGKDFTYDSVNDVFIPPQDFPSWTFNESTYVWDAPIAKPTIITEDTADPVTWSYQEYWDEDAYQADNTKGWYANKTNDTGNPQVTYEWNGTAWIAL